MQDRQFNLLASVVRSYVQGAEPVGSKALEGALHVSSATIRNDMVELEEQGYLAQPHTSAGRVPTAKGYQFYVDNLLCVREPKANEQRTLKEVIAERAADPEQSAKELAKLLARFAGEAAVVGFGPGDVYYTGLANLFAQPEFGEVDMVRTMSRVIDHLDEAFSRLFQEAHDEVKVRLGDKNPFGANCAIVFATYPWVRNSVVFALLGPLRMDYDGNIGRLTYVKKLTVN